jgi:hypothetical protein
MGWRRLRQQPGGPPAAAWPARLALALALAHLKGVLRLLQASVMQMQLR